MNRRYLLISPGRNEAQYMRQTLDSVIAQSLRPALWVIVDDGSTDETPQILAEYASKHDWIRIVTRSDRGKRAVGPGVIEAFYSGYATITPTDYEYLCKLDLDLILPPRYFEILMERMEGDERIATCSGKSYIHLDGEFVSERHGDETSIGATKFYRRDRFEQLGGFVREVMWDGIDVHRCRMMGWQACSWDVPELRFTHLRPQGTSQKGALTGRMRHGFGQYFMGTSPIYMLANAINRFTEKPYVIAGVAMWWGYVWSWLQCKPRYDNLEFRRFLRHWQWRALLVGKSRAVAEVLKERQPAQASAGLQDPSATKVSRSEAEPFPVPPGRAWPRSRMLNVWVDNLSMKQLMEKLDAGVVFTLNPDHLYHLQRHNAFYKAYRQADFITSDSKYVYWGLRWIGRAIQEKVSGSDIVPAYCAYHRNNPNVKVFLLGAAPGIAQTALERINARSGREVVVRALSPSMKFVNDEREIAETIGIINESGATCLIIGLGAPKQEIWITKYRHLMPNVKVYMGVGATIDYEAGAVKRSPVWMSRVGLEWLYRITTEPRRYWRRYLRDLEYFWLLLLDGLGLYKSPMRDTSEPSAKT